MTAERESLAFIPAAGSGTCSRR